MLAWHFIGETLLDGRPIPPDGETLVHDGPLKLCEYGLHASRRLIDALWYAPESTICRVECDGEIIEDTDKLVCSQRTILWRVDGNDLLHRFARRCALDVIHLWNAPDVVIKYLKTGDETLRASAWIATHYAARDAAGAAAAAAAARGAAAWTAAAAARDAAAADVAWAAAEAAALARQNRRLTAMVMAEHRRQQ